MIAIKKSGMCDRVAVAMASGAINAAVAMFPGPIDESAAPSKKNITGITPRLPRHKRTA
jgi:hypothetical protein